VWLPGLDDAAQQTARQQSERTRDVAELALLAVHRDDNNDSESDSGSESSFSGSDAYTVEDVIEDLKTDIQCLVDLGPRYKEPIRDQVATKEEAVLVRTGPAWDPAEYLASRIRHRYPEGDIELTGILGRVNWDRLQRLYATKEANTRDREAQQRPGLAPISQAKPSGSYGTVKGTEFHDSGLGTSVKTPSSYAETVLSYQGTQGGSVKIPPVPPECLKGGNLVCDICGAMCSLPASNPKSFWKYVDSSLSVSLSWDLSSSALIIIVPDGNRTHVLSDLQPYICVMSTCAFSMAPFPDKRAWASHLGLDHGLLDTSNELQCPLCQEQLQGGKVAHLARHLEEISLTILPVNALANDEGEQDSSGDESDQDGEETSTASSTGPGDDREADEAGQDTVGWSEARVLSDFKAHSDRELGLTDGETVWVLDASWRNLGSDWIEVLRRDHSAQGVAPRSHLILTGDPAKVEPPEPPAKRQDPNLASPPSLPPSPPPAANPPRVSELPPGFGGSVSQPHLDTDPTNDSANDRPFRSRKYKRRTMRAKFLCLAPGCNEQFSRNDARGRHTLVSHSELARDLGLPPPWSGVVIEEMIMCPFRPCPYLAFEATEMEAHTDEAHGVARVSGVVAPAKHPAAAPEVSVLPTLWPRRSGNPGHIIINAGRHGYSNSSRRVRTGGLDRAR